MPSGSLVNDSQKVNITNSVISYHWNSADATDAPDATNIPNYTVGVGADGVAAGIVFHVIDGSWVSTTATVANLYGG